MDVEYGPRPEGGIKRGRRKTEAPPEVLAMLRKTYDEGNRATIPARGMSPREVREAVTILKNGAAQLGYRLRVETDLRRTTPPPNPSIRFYVEDHPA